MKTLDLFNLKDQIAVITGGAGFLGKEHAEALLDAESKVVLLDLNKEILDSEVKRLNKKFTGRVFGFAVDIASEKQIVNIVEKIEKEIGSIRILINNAAYNPPPEKFGSRFETFPLEQWNKEIAVGLSGAFLMSKAIGPKMARRNKGVIINIASDLGVVAPDQRIYKKKNVPENEQPTKPVTYSVIKHGIVGLTKYLATYFAKDGVRVNSISPGGVFNGQNEEFVKKVSELIPLGRMAEKNEYRAAILFLASDASTYMTGSNLIIDGGRTCW